MSTRQDWKFLGSTSEGKAFQLGGLDVWKHEWRDTQERAYVKDPIYHQDFTFHVYEISSTTQVVTFAAGEFSNCMWGFFVRGPTA
ncbi:hypothetical protein [Prosthecobacter sp.]|uniref:hypothetical protein n=1 Tax=Prosthecobacter sp. TaxID=1965333 RepID=UPI0037851C56